MKIKVVIFNKNECARGNIVSLFNNAWIDLRWNEMCLQQKVHVMCHFHDQFLVASGGLYFKAWFLRRCWPEELCISFVATMLPCKIYFSKKQMEDLNSWQSWGNFISQHQPDLVIPSEHGIRLRFKLRSTRPRLK